MYISAFMHVSHNIVIKESFHKSYIIYHICPFKYIIYHICTFTEVVEQKCNCTKEDCSAEVNLQSSKHFLPLSTQLSHVLPYTASLQISSFSKGLDHCSPMNPMLSKSDYSKLCLPFQYHIYISCPAATVVFNPYFGICDRKNWQHCKCLFFAPWALLHK